MYQAVIFSFKVLQNFIVYESADDALLTYQRWTCFLEPSFFPLALKMV